MKTPVRYLHEAGTPARRQKVIYVAVASAAKTEIIGSGSSTSIPKHSRGYGSRFPQWVSGYLMLDGLQRLQ